MLLLPFPALTHLSSMVVSWQSWHPAKCLGPLRTPTPPGGKRCTLCTSRTGPALQKPTEPRPGCRARSRLPAPATTSLPSPRSALLQSTCMASLCRSVSHVVGSPLPSCGLQQHDWCTGGATLCVLAQQQHGSCAGVAALCVLPCMAIHSTPELLSHSRVCIEPA